MNMSQPILLYSFMQVDALPIRMTLYQIGIQFVQELITEIPSHYAQLFQLVMNDVPYLIYEGVAICGIWPIVKYCCVKFNRRDLLGKALEDQVRVAQLASKYMNQKNTIINTLVSTLQNIPKFSHTRSNSKSIQQLHKFIFNTKYFQASRKMLYGSIGFLRKELTIIDFILFSITNLLIQILGEEAVGVELASFSTFFKNTQFYLKHVHNIERYAVYGDNKDVRMPKGV